MASTHHQILLHFVFAVKGRQNMIRDDFREELHKYIAGIVESSKDKLLAVGSSTDHLHVFVGLHPTSSPSNFMRVLKSNASRFINEKAFTRRRFEWQDGYGVFSHSPRDKQKVIEYVLNQREHHRKHTFREEYLAFLKAAGIEYDPEYLPEWITGEVPDSK
jgi:REP element-mobilizing transposase RayT